MRSRLTIFLIGLVGLIFGLMFARQVYLSRGLPRERFQERKIKVLTYANWVGATGPGTALFNRFEREHQVQLDVVTTSDAGILLERLKLAPAGEPFDVVLGLDQFLLEKARAQTPWRLLNFETASIDARLNSYVEKDFIPFDWSLMTFVYRKGEIEPPQDFNDLLSSRFKKQIALQDPRASTPGLQFLNWTFLSEGDRAPEFLTSLAANVQSVSPTWAFSYGIFKKKQAALVFSYVTSLAFHWSLEHDRSYQVASFASGHPVQVEYAGVPTTCHECELGEALVKSLLDPQAQTEIMERNFMYPVRAGVTAGSVFAELPDLKLLPFQPTKPLAELLKIWNSVFKQ